MMSPDELAQLDGEWSGENRLWMSPQEPARESAATASIARIAQGQFIRIEYTWVYEGEPQDGILLAGVDRPDGLAVWTDSWHMSRNLMMCTSDDAPHSTISVSGSYAAPPGPDWGWRIAVQLESAEKLVLRMYNEPPGESEQLAVEAVYARHADYT